MKIVKLMNKLIVFALFAFYLYAIIRVILFKFRFRDLTYLTDQLQTNLGNPVHLINEFKMGNFIPFKTIFLNSHRLSSWPDFSNLVGNIVAFIPFGMFLILLSKNRGMSFGGVFVGSFCFTLCIESLQVVFSLGVFDVDDLILNTFGGLLGYCAIKLCDTVYNKFIHTSSSIQDREIVDK
ncbi:VanZ family protein [Bacillus sp. AFS055030]|uniref:VanZ family protein n=1 Tax=Bacillus sp. AFS055030 TaxID=2033507 RepID=UPI000BFE8A05|nr:VanZ family protein [Bacillus sp. AFS055030]PGL72190.1 VanZ family protein [Bacillus sp. AFS055030]